jgi:hypothetical protein
MTTTVMVQQKTNKVVYLEYSLMYFSQQIGNHYCSLYTLKINNDNNVNANKTLVSYNTIKN